jgi:Bacterial Ig domain
MNMTEKLKSIVRVRAIVSLLALALLLAGCGGGGSDDVDFSETFPNSNFPTNPSTPLIAAFDSYEATEDTFLQVDELFGVLANDDYPIFDTTIEYPFFTDQGGDLDGYQDGSFDYDPPPGFTGEDTFTYTLRDDMGRTSSAQVYISVFPVGFQALKSSPTP